MISRCWLLQYVEAICTSEGQKLTELSGLAGNIVHRVNNPPGRGEAKRFLRAGPWPGTLVDAGTGGELRWDDPVTSTSGVGTQVTLKLRRTGE